ncbi:MAG TPA: FAD-dependent oxidoreductase [Streptosporangiaceae bacterium]|nr:FAD-dependent oxidoreductase [Streptosporangiaceae bacterium]
MSLPALLAVDQSHDALGVLESQLTQRYAYDYRVMCLGDPAVAAQKLTELARAGEDVALVLCGLQQSTAARDGLLERVRELHPQAKRALLVPINAWADKPTADAIRAAIAFGRADYYVVRPGGPPDEVFHEAVSSFLLEWATERRIVPHTVHIIGEAWSGRAYELREVFERCAAPHAFCLADSDEGRGFLAQAGPDAKLPVMLLPDGRVLSDPSNDEIAEAAGAPSDFAQGTYDAIVVGAGPAGLSAAVYGGSDGLRILVVDEAGIGGQVRSSSLIRNYLGFPKGVSGARLAEQAYEQASVFGASFMFMHRATALTRSGPLLSVSLDGHRQVTARTVVLATGATYRRLGVPALEKLNGAGVYYGGPVSEAPAVSGKEAYVLGGGNSAGQAALHLARYARRVVLLVRGESLEAGMSDYLIRGIKASQNVEVRTGTAVAGGGGAGRLQQLVLREIRSGKQESVSADALFVLIGAHPHTDWLPAETARSAQGFLLTGEEFADECAWPLDRRPYSLETSIPGVLAAGDVRHSSVKRVASAVGEGSIAMQLVQTLLASEHCTDWPGREDPRDHDDARHRHHSAADAS